MQLRDRISWDHAYDSFPVNREYIWLNNCGTTPAGEHVCRDVQDFMEKYSRKGVYAAEYPYAGIRGSIQRSIAGLINCLPEEVALVHNTSEGMNLVSWGLGLVPGDEILLLEDEYPSNIYPWEHWREKGVALTFVAMAASPEKFLENFRSKISPRSRLAALSSVHWCTGMPLPVREISGLCRERGVGIALDAAQGAGHVEIDFRSWGIDYLTISAWKWLLGPLGLALLVISGKSLPGLTHVFKGTESVTDDALYFPYRDTLKPTAERYSYSTGSILDWDYFKSSLEYLGRIGFSVSMKRIYELADYLSAILRDAGFRLHSDAFPETRTGIIVAEKAGEDMERLEKELMARGVIARRRRAGIRFAPHIYNSFEQLDRAGIIVREIISC